MNVSEIKIPVPWGHIAADSHEEVNLNTQSKETNNIQKDAERKKLSKQFDGMDNVAVKNTPGESNSELSIVSAQSLLTKLGLKSITLSKSVPQGRHSPPICIKKVKKVTDTKSNTITNSPVIPDAPNIQKQLVKNPSVIHKTSNENKVFKPKKEERKLEKSESHLKAISKTPSHQEKKRETMPPIPGLMKRTDPEENSDFMKTYNIVKIKNPQLLASRTAKLNLIKQTLLNIENEKNSKSSGKDKSEKRCDDCGTPLSSGRDFIIHRDKCEVRQKKLEKILSGLKLPKSLQNTPEKDESQSSPTKTNVPDRIITNLTDRFEVIDRVTSPIDKIDTDGQFSKGPLLTEADIQEKYRTEDVSSQKTLNKTNKSPFRSLYNLYDGLNKEHLNIILKASRNERTLRSRSQETDDQRDKESNQCKNNNSETSQSEIIITTRITGNVIERNTMIRPVQNDTEAVPVPSNSNEPESTVDEGQANSRTLYEALKNSCQNSLVNTETDSNEQDATAPPQPQRELISDCPQGLPRSANIRKLLKRNVLNPIRRKGPILSDKFLKMDRKIFTLERSKIKALKKNEKLASLLNNLIENPNLKKNIISKKKKFVEECQKDLKTSWQIEETEKRNEEERNARALRANRRIRRMEDKPEGENDNQHQNESSEQEIVQTKQAEQAKEKEEEQVVPTANLFIPYNFVSAVTPLKDASRLEKTQSETPIAISSQLSETDIDPIPVSPQAEITDVKSFVEELSTETNSQEPYTPITQRKVSSPSRKTKSSAVKTPKTPYTPKSKEQLMLKQEIMEELRKLESRKWCKVCKKPFANNSTLTLHYSSLAHKKLVEKNLFGGYADNVTKEKKTRGRKKPTTTLIKKTANITPETSDNEMEESLWEEEEEEQIVLSEYEDVEEEEPVEKKAKRGDLSETLPATSENEPLVRGQPARRSRRSSTLDKTDSKENTNEENKETTHASPSPTQTLSSKSKDKNLCTTCNVSFPSELQLNKHYASKMHKTASFIVADGKPKVCSVCKVSFTTNNQLHRHYATQLHKTAAAKLFTELEGRGVIKTALFP